MARGRETLFRLILSLLTVLFIALALEVTSRATGYQPWSITKAEITVEPGQTFYQAHPSLGYTHLPGQFKVTLSGSYVFQATHSSDTLRITQPPATSSQQSTPPEIWIFGDSVTYGWSVNDGESYPWLLHERLPEYRVVNFGVGGYGTVHALIQLREALTQQQPPKLAIIAYASWHDPRNTLIRARRKMLLSASHLGPLNHPYARLAEDVKVQIVSDTLEYRAFPLMRYSAFMHAVEQTYNAYEERRTRSHDITKLLMKEIIELCKARGINVIIAGLTSDATTSDLLSYCDSQGAKTININVDLTIKENTNLPFDSHPSAAAHRQYAEKLAAFISSSPELDIQAGRLTSSP